MSGHDDPPPTFAVDPQTPCRRIRHRSSLEHILNFTLLTPKPTQSEASEAYFIYHEILNDCEAAELFLAADDGSGGADGDGDGDKVYLHNLFRALIEFSPTVPGGLNIVRMILHGLFSSDKISPEDRTFRAILPLARTWVTKTETERQTTFRILETIATDFLLGFFVPLTAQSSRTPRVSGILTAGAPNDLSRTQGTPHRLRGLRQICLLRDANRCVVTGHLDKEIFNRAQRRGRPQTETGNFGVQTQAAHIIPHSLNVVSTLGDRLSTGKSFVWQILNMFDPGISTVLEGPLIDTPANAMILATELHDEFGRLRCYFDELAPGTYRFRKTRYATSLSPAADPKADRITFANHEPAGTALADLPSARLLKIHAACCKMMEMAGAADFVESVIDDLERMEDEGTLAGDGSSDLGMLLRIKGLWDGQEDQEVEENFVGAGKGLVVV